MPWQVRALFEALQVDATDDQIYLDAWGIRRLFSLGLRRMNPELSFREASLHKVSVLGGHVLEFHGHNHMDAACMVHVRISGMNHCHTYY